MSRADELLSSLSEDDISLQLVNPDTEPHIVISEDRFITVPEELHRIAVQFDHDVETVTFDCPRYWDGLDMSELSIYINYMRKDRYVGCYKATDIAVDSVNSSIMHFNWKISRNVSEVAGELKFLVCIKKGDSEGYEVNHWNSELNNEMYISEGLELGSDYFDAFPDIIAQWEDEVNQVKQILLDAKANGEFTGPAGYSPRILVRDVDDGHELVITDVSGSQTVKVTDGTNGTNGENGYSPKIVVRNVDGGHQLVITDYSGSQTIDVMDGTDGVSPTVAVATITGGHRVTITDKDGAKTFDVLDGSGGSGSGTAGVSPTVSVVEITGGHRVTITDVDGAKSFDVMDGSTGATGPAGENGYSPKILVRDVDGGHELVITDYSGSKTVSVMDGAAGAAGVSPSVAVSSITGGHRVAITDASGTKTFDVMDGEGSSSGGGTTVQIGGTEPTSGPTFWFDTSE